MSLKFRLNLVINLLFLLFLAGLCLHAIVSARQTVAEEVRSVSNLTTRLLGVALSPEGAPAGGAPSDGEPSVGTQAGAIPSRLLDELQRLEATRHLRVRVYRGAADRGLPPGAARQPTADAPAWFVALIRPPPMEFRRVFASPSQGFVGIVVTADPSDEITEAWRETRDFLLSLLLFTLLANGLIFFVLRRDLAPIKSILGALERIERGDYQLRLPSFSTPEFSSISAKFNNMTAVLSASRKENRYLTRRTLEIQEQERRALARDLHDELGQSVSAVKAVAVAMGREAAGGTRSQHSGASMAEQAAVIQNLADDMYAVARRLIRQLRPAALDELGLAAALQEMVDDWNAAHAETFCHLRIEGDCAALDEFGKIHLYRIAQEGLTNISRHAAAKDAHITLLRRGGGAVSLTIRDDGRGFDPQSVNKGLGLLGIRERVDYMAGEIKIESAPGDGVTIMIEIPIDESAGQEHE